MMEGNGRKGLSALNPAGRVWGSLAGAVGGGSGWLWIMAAVCADWTAAAFLVAAAAVIYAAAGLTAARNPRRYFFVAALATAAVAALNIAAVSLRWDAWRTEYQIQAVSLLDSRQTAGTGISAPTLLLIIVPIYTLLITMMFIRQWQLDRAEKTNA